MKNYPFTPEGVQELLQDLYQLPDAELQQEAELVQADFITWVSAHFQLDANQLAFLNGIAEPTLFLMAAQVAFAMYSRLPITLIKPEVSVRGSKFIDPNGDLRTTSDGNGNMTASGSVTIEIRYA